MPVGVTASFSPVTATTAASSKVTFNVGASAPAGTYSLTITGISGTLSKVTTIGLTVIVPSFNLVTSATSLTIPEVSSGNSTISVSGVNGFAGSVNLTVTGLPSGVTASFSPLAATTTAPSKVTFNVGASASAGTYPVTITGTSGTLNSTIPISLTVVAPSFSLAASPTSLIIPRAGSGSSTISVSGINGFNGKVSFAATGLPSGVTASFSPSAASSKVSFNVGASAPAGTYSLTITGTSGTLSKVTTIGLTVIVPSFNLVTSATSLTIPKASSGNTTISVSSVNGFAGGVNFAATGLPRGVTASFSPLMATTTAPSKITFNVGASVPTGTYAVTITGTSGTINNSPIIEITITAPTVKLSLQPGSLEVAGADSLPAVR